MKSTIIAPKETAPSLTEVKRALLTFDKVCLISPDDTDLMPSNLLLTAIGMPPFFSMPGGEVRPINRMPGYEDDFSKLLDECKLAIKQGSLEVISTYNKPETQQGFIGMVPTGGYPLNPEFLLYVYRNLASNQQLLTDAINDNMTDLLSNKDLLCSIAKGGSADKAFNINGNAISALPNIDAELSDDSLRIPLTQIARGRIATAIKIAGFCESKEMVPFYTSTSYERIINRLLSHVHYTLDQIPDEDRFWEKRNRILRVLHNEYLDHPTLDDMPIKEVLKLRTKVWEKQALGKDKFQSTIIELAIEAKANEDFEGMFVTQIKEYNKLACELEYEREKLKHKLGFSLTGMFSTIKTAHFTVGSFISPFSNMETTLLCAIAGIGLVGGIIAPNSISIDEKEKSLKNSKGFALCSAFNNMKT